MVQVDGKEFKAPEVVLVGHFQRGKQVLILGCGVFVFLDGVNVRKHRFLAVGHKYGVKAALLAPSVEIGCIESQRVMDLKPGNAEGHHDIGNSVGLGE